MVDVISIKMHQSLTMANIPIKTHPTHNVSVKTLVIVDILFKTHLAQNSIFNASFKTYINIIYALQITKTKHFITI